MKTIKNGCSTPDCQGKVQAACFTCSKMYCFNCSMNHAKQNTSKNHNIMELDESLKQIQLLSKKLMIQADKILGQSLKKSASEKTQHSQKLSPEKFQQQLDQINFMKKQTLKVVQKFYSEISLQLVNIWEFYLKKFSSLDDINSKLKDIKGKIKQFSDPWNINENKQHVVRMFFKESFTDQISFYHNQVKNAEENINNIPKCPSIRIDDRVLVQLSEVLCSAISTVNFSLNKVNQKKGQENSLNINIQNYLHKSVQWLPIFPIKKKHCFLYNFNSKTYEIQQFNDLEHLPDYPKTIIIPNGDIHILGGIKNQIVVDTHLVFRSASSEVFKLANMPLCRNPSNSLVYYNKHIYLIGGLNQKSQWDKRCLKYSLEHKQWKQISSMFGPKPHQSCAIFNDSIYCFGIPQNKKINIEHYNIEKDEWEQVIITNFLSNPFNFASGFISIQISPSEILLFGGKRFLQNATNNKRSTDRSMQQHVYTFQPQTNSFNQKGALFPGLGVQYGQFYPIVLNNKIYSCQYLLCKNNPISRWYDNLQIIQIQKSGNMESIIILDQS